MSRRPGSRVTPNPNVDRWVTPAESREEIVGLYRRVWGHSDVMISTLGLDSVGWGVLWWPEDRRNVPRHRILVQVIAETHRHAGHTDIVGDLIDGATGLQEDNGNMAPGDQAWRQNYHNRLEHAAQEASQTER